MSVDKIGKVLAAHVQDLESKQISKGNEMIVNKIIPANEERGPRYRIEGYNQDFIKMNANSYLGISMHPEVIKAEEEAALTYGVGPGAVRFISGTHKPHIDLEKKIAEFHGREKAMIFSSAYVTSLGVIYPLINKETVVISDELNHNCIINAMRLSRPAKKMIYKHNDMQDLREKLEESKGLGKRVIVVTDGVFSMRGDFCPLKEFVSTCKEYDQFFEEGVVTVADDSHGVGAFGSTGRGTEEVAGAKVDILIGTLGKAFGVNGGYVTTTKDIIAYLKETAPMYIYSNPITCSEAAAATKVLDILDSEQGRIRLKHLKAMTEKFEKGLKDLGLETIEGPHPVVPLMLRDTQKTTELVSHLIKNGVLATGLNFPVVPKGDEEIRFQVNADHKSSDIDNVLEIIADYVR